MLHCVFAGLEVNVNPTLTQDMTVFTLWVSLSNHLSFMSCTRNGSCSWHDWVINRPFAHGCLFWPGCQICNVSVGSIWRYAKFFNNIVARSICYRTVKLWWIHFKVGIFYNYFSKPTLCETAAETDSSARMQRSLDGRVVIGITHAGAARNRLSVERQQWPIPLASWSHLARRLPPCMVTLLDAHGKTDKECDTCGTPVCKTRPPCSGQHRSASNDCNRCIR